MAGLIRSPLQLLRALFKGQSLKPVVQPRKKELWRPPEVLIRTQDFKKVYEESVRISLDREQRYKDYEDMILDSVISSALELMTDDVCQYSDEHHATVWVSAKDSELQIELMKMLDLINIEDNIWDWTYNTLMYGDFFLRVDGRAEVGVEKVEDDFHPGDIQRLDVNGQLYGFRVTNAYAFEHNTTMVPSKLQEPWEYIHFRVQASQRRRREVERARMSPSHRYDKDPYRVTTKYGVSMIESARRIYKQLQMVEQSLIIARMSRALLKYVYHVQVGEQASPKEAVQTVRRIKDEITQNTGIKIGEDFEQTYSPLAGSEDIFLPQFGDRGKIDVDKLGGDVDVHAIVDVDRLRTKLYGALKIPPPFLGDTSELPGGIGESALYRMAIRYARTTNRGRRGMITGLTRLCQVHLAYIGEDPDPERFSVEMETTSSAEDEERKNALSSGLAVGRDVISLFKDLGLQPDRKKLATAVMTMLHMGDNFNELAKESEAIVAEEEFAPPDIGAGIGAPTPIGGGMAGAPEEEAPPPEEAGEGPLVVPGESVRRIRKSNDLRADLPGKDKAGKDRDTRVKIAEKTLDELLESAFELERSSGDNGKDKSNSNSK